MAYAHSVNDRGQRDELVQHLRDTAALAAEFAAAFGGGDAARYLGLWHDLGKFNPKWQDYLLASEASRRGPVAGREAAAKRAAGLRTDHKAAGTQLAVQHLRLPALLIQGHHGGLRAAGDLKSWLAERAADPSAADALTRARQALPDLEPVAPIGIPPWAERDARTAEFFLRMLFSALVDADFLDTEEHFNHDIAAQRGADVTLPQLWERFARDHSARFAEAPASDVNTARREVYDACLTAAESDPGIFRLTVPTGGGKTRAGMAFALRHAIRNRQRRVIVAVPFISITEQTAAEYRTIFDDDGDGRPVVLEHHSGVDAAEGHDDRHDEPEQTWARLAAENWDAPIIVTTTVQLLESMFANKTGRCRKLHRLAGSVIILDEAQSLPPHLLNPILDGLRELTAHYGTTVVLSTATQPAFESIAAFRDLAAPEIVPEPERYFERLRRVSYEWRTEPALEWSEVAGELRGTRQALAIVNTKKDALALLDALGDEDALHLSTLLCGAHRRQVIVAVRRRLREGAPCRLVSTQVVEAGVDLDFPLVLRALGPLDGIIQAAGRCNREGRMGPRAGQVIVFRPAEGGLPMGDYRIGAGIAEAIVGGGDADLDRPEVARAYFTRLFETVQTDRDGVQKLRESLDYPETAKTFRMINDDTESVVVTTYGTEEGQASVRRTLDALRDGYGNARALLRRLQPYVVAVQRYQADAYRRNGFIQPVIEGLGEWAGKYDTTRGLVAADQEFVY